MIYVNIGYDKYNINKNNNLKTIILTGINNIIGAKWMFFGGNSL